MKGRYMQKNKLSKMEYAVTQLGETEPPFSHCGFPDREGDFFCVCCEEKLFSSNSKFESGSGWPSFSSPLSKEAVTSKIDLSHGMRRIEVSCSNCKAHLGHVFEDGPAPTGLRYCINGAALRFRPT